MIEFVYPLHPQTGRRLDLSCPLILCDACRQQIDTAHPGNVLWKLDDEAQVWHAHKGRCTRHLDRVAGEHLMSREVSTWLAQLANNYERPLIGSTVEVGMDGTEYPCHAFRTQAEDAAWKAAGCRPPTAATVEGPADAR